MKILLLSVASSLLFTLSIARAEDYKCSCGKGEFYIAYSPLSEAEARRLYVSKHCNDDEKSPLWKCEGLESGTILKPNPTSAQTPPTTSS